MYCGCRKNLFGDREGEKKALEVKNEQDIDI